MQLKTKIYLSFVILTGLVLLALLFINNSQVLIDNSISLLILCALGSAGLIFNVYGFTQHSHLNTSFLIYSFTLFQYGPAHAALVILVSHLVEWPIGKYKWHVQAFNIGQYIISLQAIVAVFALFNYPLPLESDITFPYMLVIVLALMAFVLVNHILVGIVIWLVSGESFAKSGTLSLFPLALDFTFLSFGLTTSFLWGINPSLSALAIVPVYLMYSTLRVPALERASEIDPKTGLYNAAFFVNSAQNEIARAKRFGHPLCIVMADMDLLRNINNTYGHLAGDRVLIEVAQILKESFREYDIVARFGGEEFSIMMPETGPDNAYKKIEEVRKLIDAHEILLNNQADPIRVSLSFGVCSLRVDDLDVLGIIHFSDIALYLAKLSGRNRTVVYNSSEYETLISEFSFSESTPMFLNIEDRIGKIIKGSVPTSPRKR